MLYTLQQICHMTKHIFHILPCLIRHFCKQSKSGYIHKYIFIERSDIAGKCFPIHNIFCRLKHILGQSQTTSEIIGTSRRNITDGCGKIALHHASDHLIQSSITTAAHHQIIDRLTVGHDFYGIPFFLGRINGDFISAFCKNIKNVCQFIADLCFSRLGIIYKKHFFHPIYSLLSCVSINNLVF